MNVYNFSENEAEADAKAFAADAIALRDDFDSILPNLNVKYDEDSIFRPGLFA
jgi:hypothetical protein